MPVLTRDLGQVDTSYARDISFPLRFNEDCDLFLDEDQEVVEQAINLAVFVSAGSIRLYPKFGSSINLSLFENFSQELQLILDTSIRSAIEGLEPRLVLDKEFVFDVSADEKRIICIIPYRLVTTGEISATRLVIDRPLNG